MKLITDPHFAFECDGNSYTLSSTESAIYPGEQIVSLLGRGVEVTVVMPTRGEGMLLLSETLKLLGHKMSMLAFELASKGDL